jgi:hypothetical protein
MSVFFCHAKLIHNAVRIGIFWVCWHVDHHQLSICFDHLFASQQWRPQVLTTMAEQSPMRTIWVNTREHLGTKWEKGTTIRKRDSMDLTGRRSTVQEVLRQSSFQFIQRTLEQLGVNFNISSPRYCRPLLISLARGLEDLRCLLIHFCGIVCMTCL